MSTPTAPVPKPAPPKPRPPEPRPPQQRPAASAPATETLDREKLFTARLHAARARPYLATALFALHVVESHRVPTMAVDSHWRCYVSPSFVAQTSLHELAAVWVHEVSHLLRDHHGRSERYARRHGLTGPAEGLRMNIAADLEINDDAFGDGLVRPAGALVPRRLKLPDGLLMEEYLRSVGLGKLTEPWAWLDCGSGSDGREREWDLGPEGAHGLAGHERDAVRFRVAEGIRAAQGSVPQGWRRWAEEAFHPPQPWRQLLGSALRAAVSGAGTGEDYTYGRPARRSAGLPGVVLPSLRRRPPRVAVVIDTSGSVSDAELGTALLEVTEIARAVGNRRDQVSVVSCDASAGAARSLCSAEGIELIGGGGTDLRAGFARALQLRPRPDVLVVLTDGQTDWPSAPPPARTVIGLFPRVGCPDLDEVDPDYVPPVPPSWARTVHLGG
ncbi:VWA-like domain-containing protein [Kitasatospora sp. NPDC051853]|uniref:vWA domain-containing protein n=1 Tax=Kitasatospora sp. NPDC051853 TaxID=3364058 RepID=UPI00379CBC96